MTDPLVLSASSVREFLTCGLRWEFSYVYGYRPSPSVRQAIGIAAHRAIEVDMVQKVETMQELPTDQVLDAFSDSYDTEIYGWEAGDDPETPPEGKDSGIRLVEMASEHVLPRIQPMLVEQAVQFKVNGIPYSGVIDAADLNGRIIDWKTTKRRPSAINPLQTLQMTGYALGYRQLSGMAESEVVLHYFVRTKTPQHVPAPSGGPVNNATVASFSRVVTEVHRQITRGNFAPNGLANGACGYCPFTQICPAYKEFRP
jgi:CRISPR/Cas system-associated exonuclease Cas4 (RecB family)